MNIDQLYRDLQSALENGHIRIDSDTFDSVFSSLLNRLCQNQLDGTQCVLEREGETLILNGIVALRASADNLLFSFSLVCFPEEAGIRSKLTLRCRDDLVPLADLFVNIAPSVIFTGGIKKSVPSIFREILLSRACLTLDTEEIPPGERSIDMESNVSISTAPAPSPPEASWSRYAFLLQSPGVMKGKVRFLPAEKEDGPPAADFLLKIPLGSRFALLSPLSSNESRPFEHTGLSLMLESRVPDTQNPPVYTSRACLNLRLNMEDWHQEFILMTVLFQHSAYWSFMAEFEPGLTVSSMTRILGRLLLLPSGGKIPLPDNFPLLDAFGLYGMNIVLKNKKEGSLDMELESVGTLIRSTHPWKTFIPGVSLDCIGMNIRLHRSARLREKTGNGLLMSGEILGLASLKQAQALPHAPNGWELKLAMAAILPSFDIEGRMVLNKTPDKEATLDSLLQNWKITPVHEDTLRIASARLSASPSSRSLSLYAEINPANAEKAWSMQVCGITISLTHLYVQLLISPGVKTAEIGGTFRIGKTHPFSLAVSAAWKKNTWCFSGRLSEGFISLARILEDILGITPSGDPLFDIRLTLFSLRYETGPNGSLSVKAALLTCWDTRLLGREMSLYGEIALLKKSDRLTLGLSARFTLGSFEISASLADALAERKSYTFGLRLGKLDIKASNGVITKNGQIHEILSLSMAALTLGELVNSLISLANPNAECLLPPPWDFLNKIPLPAFKLIFDTTDSSLEAFFTVNLHIPGIIRIDEVGLRHESGNGGKTLFLCRGAFCGQEYGPGKELSWDAVNENPPEIPGKGPDAFRLCYLGLGQHLEVDVTGNTIEEVLLALKKQIAPSSEKNPSLRYSKTSRWLLGVEFLLQESFKASIVLNDPDLYGIVVTVTKAKESSSFDSLAGLRAELLYRKLSDNLGMFCATLTIPERFRTFNLGYLSITLGTMSLELYTNGDFLLDMGFPHNADFSASFVIQAGIYTGRGGFYLGILSGATCSKVPAVTSGEFTPVLTLGLGLSLGLDRTFSFGPVRGGLTLEVFGIFEGVFALYRPFDRDRKKELYCRASAIIGLSGRLFLCVDLKIISINAEINVRATLMLVFETCRASLVELDLRLSVKASIKILFIKISFSFDFHLYTSFTLGSDSAPPWTLASLPSRTSARDRQLVRDALPRKTMRISGSALSCPISGRFRDKIGAFTLPLTLIPVYSTQNISWENKREAAPSHCAAFLLFIGTEPRAGGKSDFSLLVQSFAFWLLSLEEETEPDRNDSRIGYAQFLRMKEAVQSMKREKELHESLRRFFLNHGIHFTIGLAPEEELQGSVRQTFFPVFPGLRFGWSTKEEGEWKTRNIAFDAETMIGADYIRKMEELFSRMNSNPDDRELRREAEPEERDISLATLFFNDYFSFLADSIIGDIEPLFRTLPLAITTGSLRDFCETLIDRTGDKNSVARLYREGDTLATLCDWSGLTSPELLDFNPDLPDLLEKSSPGDILSLKTGITPRLVLTDNPGLALQRDITVTLESIPYIIQPGDTLEQIRQFLGANARDMLNLCPSSPRVIRQGASFSIPEYPFRNIRKLTLSRIAALFYVRLTENAEEGDVEELFQTISRTNPGLPPDGTCIPFGASVQLPIANQWENNLTHAGDTLRRLVRYADLCSRYEQGRDVPETFTKFLATLPGSPQSVPEQIPVPLQGIIRTSDVTLCDLFQRLFPDREHACAGSNPLWEQDILSPLTRISIVHPQIKAKAGETSETVLRRYTLDLAEWADAISRMEGLFSGNIKINTPLWIPETALTEAVSSTESVEKKAAMISRFFLQGMRIPIPDASGKAGDAFEGMYALNGQQQKVMADAGEDKEERCRLSVSIREEDRDWISPALGSFSADRTITHAATAEKELELVITNGDIRKYAPAQTLFLDILKPLRPLPLFHEIEKKYALSQAVPLHDLSIPGASRPRNAKNISGIRQLPADFRQDSRGHLSRYSLYTREEDNTAPGREKRECGKEFSWVTLLVLGIRKVPGAVGLYELSGMNHRERETLRQALEQAIGARLLHTASPLQGIEDGLINPASSSENTFLVRTNLSTETEMGVLETRKNTAETHCARLSACREFLRLLWEMLIIGGKGCYLGFADQETCALPDAIFDDRGEAKLHLLIEYASSYDDREECVNALVTRDTSLDGENTWLAADNNWPDRKKEYRETLPAGCAGFSLTLAAPPEEHPSDNLNYALGAEKDLLARRLFSIASFHVEGENLPPSLPLFPSTPGEEENKETIWDFTRSAPLYKWRGDGQNPYAAIGETFNLILNFRDILGNATSSAFLHAVALRSLYTDELIDPGKIPLSAIRYHVELIRNVPSLCVSLCPQPPEDLNNRDEIKKAVTRYNSLLRQWEREDIQMRVQFTLLPEAVRKQGGFPVSRNEFLPFLQSVRNYLDALTTLPVCTAPLHLSIRDILHTYTLSPEELARANRNAHPAEWFVSATVNIPRYTVVRDTESPSRFPDAAWERNGDAPLKPFARLKHPERTYTTKAEGENLQDISASLLLPLDSLIKSNQERDALLIPGFAFQYGGKTVCVAEAQGDRDITLLEICYCYFIEFKISLTPIQLLTPEENRSCLRKTASLIYQESLVGENEHLGANRFLEPGFTLLDLISLNGDTPGLFLPGTALLCRKTAAYAPAAEETLEHICTLHAVTQEQLLLANEQQPLQAPLLLPRRVDLSAASIQTGLTLPENPEGWSIKELLQQENWPLEYLNQFLDENAPLIGILQPGQTLEKDAVHATTREEDCLTALVSHFGENPSPSSVLSEFSDIKLLKGGAKLLKPPAALLLRHEATTSGLTHPVTPLEAVMTISRNRELCAEDAPEKTISTQYPIPPEGDENLSAFAAGLENALHELKVAGTGGVGQQLYGILFGPRGIADVRMPMTASGPASPRYYAFKPLSNQWVSVYDIDLPGSEEQKKTNFLNIDMEQWAGDFLGDIDHIISPANSGRLSRLSPELMTSLIQAKKALIDALACQLVPLSTDKPDPVGLEEARNASKNQFGYSLLQGYKTGVIQQYPCTSETSFEKPARFSGDVVLNAGTEQDQTKGEKTEIPRIKLPLNSARKYLHLPITPENLARASGLPCYRRYTIRELEYNIQTEEAGWYTGSSWLKFINPLIPETWPAQLNLDWKNGDKLPLPLRACPEMPVLLNQENATSESHTLRECLAWDYKFSFSHSLASQDTLHISLTGAPPAKLLREEDSLLLQLARYQLLRPGLREKISEQSKDEAFLEGMSEASALLQKTASLWSLWVREAERKSRQTTPALEFTIEPTWEKDGETQDMVLHLKRKTPGMEAPDIALSSPQGGVTPFTKKEDPREPGTILYRTPLSGCEEKIVTLIIKIKGLSLTGHPETRSIISVSRNKNLLPEGKTNPAFIYRTPPLSFPQTVLSARRQNTIAPLDIRGSFTNWEKLFAAAFEEVLNHQLDLPGQNIPFSCEIAFSYHLSNGDSPLERKIPVFYIHKKHYSESLVKTIAERLDNWRTTNRVNLTSPKLHLNLTLHSRDEDHHALLQITDIPILLEPKDESQ